MRNQRLDKPNVFSINYSCLSLHPAASVAQKWIDTFCKLFSYLWSTFRFQPLRLSMGASHWLSSWKSTLKEVICHFFNGNTSNFHVYETSSKQQSNKKYNFMQQQMAFPILSMQRRFMNSGPEKMHRHWSWKNGCWIIQLWNRFRLLSSVAMPRQNSTCQEFMEKNQVDIFSSLLGLIKEVSRLLWRWKLYFFENFDNLLGRWCHCCFCKLSAAAAAPDISQEFQLFPRAQGHLGHSVLRATLVFRPRSVDLIARWQYFYPAPIQFCHGSVNKYKFPLFHIFWW